MRIRTDESVDVVTPTGPMRTYLYYPERKGRYPGILLFSEIYQVTAPIERLAAMIAGLGYLVAIPEIYHEYEKPGQRFAYDADGTSRGNALKYAKPVAGFDSDTAALLAFLSSHSSCNQRFGAFGVCLGGHLAFRAALHPLIEAAACFYATDLHTATLGAGNADDSLARAGDLAAELLMVWGREDPHIPLEGRRKIHDALIASDCTFSWHEFDAQHAFLRDGAPRYDSALMLQSMLLTSALFGQVFSQGVG